MKFYKNGATPNKSKRINPNIFYFLQPKNEYILITVYFWSGENTLFYKKGKSLSSNMYESLFWLGNACIHAHLVILLRNMNGN